VEAVALGLGVYVYLVHCEEYIQDY
jgi:hypothetical protein